MIVCDAWTQQDVSTITISLLISLDGMTDSKQSFDTIPLLSGLGEAERKRIASVSHWSNVSKRQLVMEKGGESQGLWIVTQGRLQGLDYTIDGREVGLYFITPGQFFGELALIDGQSHPEHVIATAASEVCLIPLPICRDLMRHHPGIANQISNALATRVRNLIRQRTLLTLATPLQRLAAQLIDLANETTQIEFIPTHQELAMMINASRETVTRAFRTLQVQGIVKRDGNRLILQHRTSLENMAQGIQGADD